MADHTCWTCGRKTIYKDDGYWHCAHCNEAFFEGEDDEGNDLVSYCESCEHSDEYPDCKDRCPYTD